MDAERLRRARQAAENLAAELAELEREAVLAELDAEHARLYALWMSMRPTTPPMVPDHVPAEWVD